MSRVISVLSSKGGVGKTTVVANLASVLAKLGFRVTAIDTNLTTPHLATQLGLHLTPHSLHHVLRDQIPLQRATYHFFGFKLVPGSLGVQDLADVDLDKLEEIVIEASSDSDFVLLDCAPTLGREAVSSLRCSDEALLVATPDFASVIDAFKTSQLAKLLGKKLLGVALNRVTGRNELGQEEIDSYLGESVLVRIPEDEKVRMAAAKKLPVVDCFPQAKASLKLRELAHQLAELPYSEPKFSLVEKLIGWMRGL